MRLAVIILVALGILALLTIEKNPAGGLRISKRMGILKEFWWFIRERKIWWMTPIILILGVLSVFIILTEQSVVLPFIYAVF